MNAQLFLFFVGVLVGLIILWWSSDKSVEYSLELSKLFGIKTFFIGFVLLAVTTGIPELAISLVSLWSDTQSVAAGTIIGSNMSDVSLILGIPALFVGPILVSSGDLANLMFMLIVTSLVMGFIFVLGILPSYIGYVLIVMYFICIFWLWKTRSTKVVPKTVIAEELSGEPSLFKLKLWFFIKLMFALAIVLLSSRLAIYSAEKIAVALQISMRAIGATLFAIGTSMPELILSIQAVRRKEYGLAFGNSFGSILEQATLILGVLVIGAPQAVDIRAFRVIAPLMFVSYAIVANSLLKRKRLGRREGLLLMLLFSVHVVYYLFFNGS